MLRAKKEIMNLANIELFTVQYNEDREIIPKGFTVLEDLLRSVLDVNQNLKKRKLPLIKDILEALKNASNANYFIYTNADIGLMPNFYKKVWLEIQKGHDAIIINRRRLKTKYFKISDLEKIYKDQGKSHPGFDCFVFKKTLLEKFILDNICVGIPFLGVTLAYNIFSFAKNPLYIPNRHLTFHIGKEVLPKRNNSFYKHNFESFFYTIKPKLKPHFKLQKFPYGDKNWLVQFYKFVLNPSLQTNDFLALKFPTIFKASQTKPYLKYKSEDKFFKIKSFLNEIRWWFLER